jgi:2-keto-4-pentenoate hydratase/2-oxohepta-3-ene-1,7-dioic acid hydratase in catechol pathway
MRLIRFRFGGRTLRGRLNLDGTASVLLNADSDDPILPLEMAFSEEKVPIDRLLSPILPVDILGIGSNYQDPAQSHKQEPPTYPFLFLKATSSLAHPGDAIPLPKLSQEVDFEGELAVIIGRTAKSVARARALEYVFGYTCANDFTARDWISGKNFGGGQFSRGKSFDGFTPLGPWIVTADEILNPHALWIKTYVNDILMQDQSTADMVTDIPSLIESLSSTMTLRPGTVILTGTPMGAGFARKPQVWLKPKDRIRIDIQGIGILENHMSES